MIPNDEKIKRVSEESRLEEEKQNNSSAKNILFMEIQNFRCFRNKVLVGPFEKITGIIGPNGGGKSTVMDAIAFCLCKDIVIKYKFFKYEDLVNNELGKSQQPVSVKIHFTLKDKQQSIERVLDSSNKFTYYVQEVKVSKEEFINFLEQNNLLGFIILHQDELQIFTSKNPNELMLLFEKISGSYSYKEAYTSCQKQLDHLNFEIVEKNDQLKNLKRDKKHSKILLINNQNVNNIYSELDEIDKDIFELNLMQYHLRYNKETNNLQALKETSKQIIDQIDKHSSQIIRLKNQIFSFNKDKDKQKVNQDLQEFEKQLNLKEEEVDDYQKDILAFEKQLSLTLEEVKNIQEQQKTANQTQEAYNETIRKYNKEIDWIIKSKTQFKNKSILSDKVFEDFTKQLSKEQAVLENISQVITATANDQSFSEKRKILLDQQLSNIISKKTLDVNDIISLQKKIHVLEDQRQLVQEQYNQLEKKTSIDDIKKFDRKVLVNELNTLKQRLNEVEAQIISDKNDQNIFTQLSSITDGFYGEFSTLISVLDRKFALSLGIIFLKIMDHLVFENFDGAKKAGSILKAHFVQRNALILSNIPARKNSNSTNELRAFIGSKGHLAIDLIQIKNPIVFLREFLEFYLNGIVVCDSIKTAASLKYDLGNRIKKIITIDGVIIKDREVTSLGIEDRYPQKLKKFISKVHFENMRKINETSDGQITQEKISNLNNDLKLRKVEIEKQIIAIENQLQHLKDDNGEDERILKDMKRQLAALEKEKIICASAIELAEKRIETADKDITGLKKDLVNIDDKIQMLQNVQRNNEEQLSQQQNKIIQLKENFVLKHKTLISSTVELEKAILATKDANAEIEKVKEKILKVQMDIAALNINDFQSKLFSTNQLKQSFEENISSLKDKINKLKTEINDLQNKLKSSLSVKLENDKRTIASEEEINNLNREILDLEGKLKIYKSQEDMKRKELEKITLEEQEYLEEVEMKGIINDPAIKGKLKNRSSQTARSQNYSQPSFKDKNITYDFKRLLDIMNVTTLNEVNLEPLIKLSMFKNQKKAELKKKLKETTTGINSDALVEVEKTKIENISEKLKSLQDNLTQMFTREKTLRSQLDDISSKRGQKLLLFLNPLSLIIPNVYKLVNCDERASASFILENPFKPFLGGLIFNATPPTKKFSIGTEGLSTGESSLANLALFLALNEVKASPLILFDEVDSHLDSENVFKFVSAIGKFSGLKQVAFVSHKSFVFKNADILLGITKNQDTHSADCYSLNLKNFVTGN